MKRDNVKPLHFLFPRPELSRASCHKPNPTVTAALKPSLISIFAFFELAALSKLRGLKHASSEPCEPEEAMLLNVSANFTRNGRWASLSVAGRTLVKMRHDVIGDANNGRMYVCMFGC